MASLIDTTFVLSISCVDTIFFKLLDLIVCLFQLALKRQGTGIPVTGLNL